MQDPLQSCNDKKSRGRCVIKGCVNQASKYITGPTPSYYGVPKSFYAQWKTERRLAWIKAIIKHNKYSSDWQPTNASVICNLHFVGGVKSEHPLHPGYNPTLFPSQKATEVEKVQKGKRQVEVVDLSENEVLADQTITVENKPKRQKKMTKKADPRPTIVLLRKNFVEQSLDEDIVMLSNDFGCQVEFDERRQTSETPVNSLICNLKVENNMNCAETQIDIKKRECVNDDLKKSKSKHKSSMGVPKTHKIEFTGLACINSNSNMINACGLNCKQFQMVLSEVPDITRNVTFVNNVNRLLISLMKFRQGLSDSALAIYFTMPQSLIHDIFNEILPFLCEFAEDRIAWIKKEVIQNYLPESFKPEYSNCRAIIDCIEIQMELPQNAEAQEEYYRSFRNFSIFKIFIACAPNGFIMYKSDCYGGQKTDEFIATDCEFLNLIQSDDVILTDKDFPNLEVALNNRNAILQRINVPPDSYLFSTYMDMRKSLNLLKHFKILSSMPIDQLENIDNIVQICCSLVNLSCLMSV